MDTTRLDVFAVDPVTLRWVQAELTVGMDWYTRCVVGIRVTPVSTKAVDAAATLYQAFRPRPAGKDWPAHAVWPEHGIPRSLLVDVEAIDGPMAGAASPAIVPRDGRDRSRQDLRVGAFDQRVSADGHLDSTGAAADRSR